MSQQAATIETTQPVAPVTEAPKEEVKETKIEESADSKRFAAVSKREAKVLKERKELELQRKHFEEEKRKMSEELNYWKEIPDLMSKKPGEAFKRLKTTYDSVTQSLLNDGKVTPESLQVDVDNKIKTLEERLEAERKAREDEKLQAQQLADRQALEAFGSQIINTIEGAGEKYSAINHFKFYPVVYEIIQKRWNDTEGKHLMTIDEAAEMLENDLNSQIDGLLQMPKYTARYAPITKKEEQKPQNLNKPKTITNELTSSAPSMLPARTENDRLKRALEKL